MLDLKNGSSQHLSSRSLILAALFCLYKVKQRSVENIVFLRCKFSLEKLSFLMVVLNFKFLADQIRLLKALIRFPKQYVQHGSCILMPL